MNILHRRIIYISFIVIFLVAAPLIILYTMGYRYNFTKGRVQKTGILSVTSAPRGADIYLNGIKYASSQTPAKIEKLLPGDYEIKLSKNGYYDWQKKLAVYENGTTFAEKVILWKKSAPTTLATSTASSWLISPDKNIVGISNGTDSIDLLDINSGLFGEISGGNFSNIVQITGYDSLKLQSFSPSGRYLLAVAIKNNKQAYFLVDTLAKSDKKLPAQDYTSIKWDASADSLYALDKTGLSNIDLSTLKTQSVLKGLATSDFYLNNKNLYFISSGVLNRQSFNDNNPSPIEKINCANCHIRDIRGGRLIAANNTGDLYIIDLNRQVKTIQAKANNFDWLNSNSLIFYNDYEIYIYDLSKSDPELITRLGSPISSAIWYGDGRYLIFSSENKIQIIELDNREFRNITSVAAAATSHLSIDRAGNNLFYSVDKSGIFKLNIQ